MHQHIFKVGWLVTKSFQTTTILYYTFFLPGVVVYEVVYWLAAGALNVRAERAIQWPEAQEIGELRLNFVKLSRRASTWRVRIIGFMPLIASLTLIWLIAISILDLDTIIQTVTLAESETIFDALQQVTTQTDFWLWAYLLFVISNTMLPDTSIFDKWWWVLIGAVAISVPFFLLGVQEEVIGGAITGPIANILNVLLIIFVIVIVTNGFGVIVLAVIENTIEYITGDSATFKNGKMIVMTREEAIAQRQKDRELARRRRNRAAKSTPGTQGPPSVYKLEFPLPGPPGDEPVSTLPVSIIDAADEAQSTTEERPKREEPAIIVGGIARNRSSVDVSEEEAKDETQQDEEPEAEAEITYEDIDDSA